MLNLQENVITKRSDSVDDSSDNCQDVENKDVRGSLVFGGSYPIDQPLSWRSSTSDTRANDETELQQSTTELRSRPFRGGGVDVTGRMKMNSYGSTGLNRRKPVSLRTFPIDEICCVAPNLCTDHALQFDGKCPNGKMSNDGKCLNGKVSNDGICPDGKMSSGGRCVDEKMLLDGRCQDSTKAVEGSGRWVGSNRSSLDVDNSCCEEGDCCEVDDSDYEDYNSSCESDFSNENYEDFEKTLPSQIYESKAVADSHVRKRLTGKIEKNAVNSQQNTSNNLKTQSPNIIPKQPENRYQQSQQPMFLPRNDTPNANKFPNTSNVATRNPPSSSNQFSNNNVVNRNALASSDRSGILKNRYSYSQNFAVDHKKHAAPRSVSFTSSVNKKVPILGNR